MDNLLQEHQHVIGGEKYYSETYLKDVLSGAESQIRIVELFEMEDAEFSRIVEQFNTFDLYDRIDIFIDSGGGSMTVKEKLSLLISQYPNVNLIACGQLASAAFLLFLEADCNKFVSDTATPCFHKLTLTTQTNEDGKPKREWDEFMSERGREFYSEYVKGVMDRCKFNKKERAVIEKDRDLYIRPERLMQMLENYVQSE